LGEFCNADFYPKPARAEAEMLRPGLIKGEAVTINCDAL